MRRSCSLVVLLGALAGASRASHCIQSVTPHTLPHRAPPRTHTSPRIVKVGYGLGGDQRKLMESYGALWPGCFSAMDPVVGLERPSLWSDIGEDGVATTSLSAVVQSVFGAPLVRGTRLAVVPVVSVSFSV